MYKPKKELGMKHDASQNLDRGKKKKDPQFGAIKKSLFRSKKEGKKIGTHAMGQNTIIVQLSF